MLQVFDDWLPIADVVREKALKAEYFDYEGQDGAIYKRVFPIVIPEVVEAIEAIYGPIDVHSMGFRLNYEGELPNQLVHSDLGWGTHAMVWYLSDGPSGTAFWKHSITNSVKYDDSLYSLVAPTVDLPEYWEIRMLVKQAFNRALFYEGSHYHSRFPFEAFGSTPEDGRLIMVAFFTPLKH